MKQNKIYKKIRNKIMFKIIPQIYVKFLFWGNFLFFSSLFFLVFLLSRKVENFQYLLVLVILNVIAFCIFLSNSFIYLFHYKIPYKSQWKRKFGISD